jgi:hypothetical protein
MAEFPPPSGQERLSSNLDPLNSIYTLYTGHKNLIILILTLIPTLILTIHCFTTLALPLPLVILTLIRLIRNFNPAKFGKSIQRNRSLFLRKFFYLEWKHFF